MPIGRLYSYFLVAMQLLLILLLIIYCVFGNLGFFQITLINLGLLLILWSTYWMRKSKLRVTPEVAIGAKLIKKGPYRYLRHPMYAAVMIFCLGLLLTNVYSMTVVFYVLLFLDLSLKITYEEKLLKRAFPDYNNYTKRTKKLIPFIY